jgi:hypothetical protein
MKREIILSQFIVIKIEITDSSICKQKTPGPLPDLRHAIDFLPLRQSSSAYGPIENIAKPDCQHIVEIL